MLRSVSTPDRLPARRRERYAMAMLRVGEAIVGADRPVASLAGGQVRILQALDAGSEWQARKASLRGAVPEPRVDLA
jgi:hypothetical protein